MVAKDAETVMWTMIGQYGDFDNAPQLSSSKSLDLAGR